MQSLKWLLHPPIHPPKTRLFCSKFSKFFSHPFSFMHPIFSFNPTFIWCTFYYFYSLFRLISFPQPILLKTLKFLQQISSAAATLIWLITTFGNWYPLKFIIFPTATWILKNGPFFAYLFYFLLILIISLTQL